MKTLKEDERLPLTGKKKTNRLVTYEISRGDLQALQAFEDLLVAGIRDAEQALREAQKRHAAFSDVIQRIEGRCK